MAHPSYDISEIMGRVADKVAAMEPTSPEVIRAVTACHALRCGRGISRHEYRKSFPTTQIKQFWSHSWQGGWRSKITTLLFLHNHIPAVICSSLGALVVASLFAAKLLPGPEWDKELWIYPRGFWAMLVGPVIYLLVLLLWQPQQSVFLDIMCIDQEDPRQKASGMLSMGAFLKCSNSLLVLWDPSYTRRLWCIFELAAFLHTRPTGKKFKLLVRPLILGPCSVLLTLTMVVVVIAIGWVPQRDGLAGSEALWGGQVLVLFIGLWAMISVSRRYFRAVEQLRNELSHFSLEETECFCCQRNHVDRSGNPIQICDRMVLLQCIRTWFGTLEVFEQMVRREVLKCLLEELSSQFFTYRHCITATIPLLWSHLDMAGAMLHYLDQWPGRTWRSALDVAILRGAGAGGAGPQFVPLFLTVPRLALGVSGDSGDLDGTALVGPLGMCWIYRDEPVGSGESTSELDRGCPETCYVTLLKLLNNIVEHPSEAKFRHLKTSNAALKAKVFDVPGAKDFLVACGFVEDGDGLDCPSGVDVTPVRDRLKKHADDAKMNELRRERDAKIAEEKAKSKKDPFTCHKELGTTEEEREAIRKKLERDRLELEAELAHRGAHASVQGHGPQVRSARGGHQLFQEGWRLSLDGWLEASNLRWRS
ncbi:unnamed protein product [Durusdinium trenchii]|uniref:PUB domain-containing protein n=1 Tax=Durusdinium trenchii TaxID=1381693 RepID=A0ABP0Q8L6_9DINO